MAALHAELRPFLLRRVKEDVEKEIPSKEETLVEVQLTRWGVQLTRWGPARRDARGRGLWVISGGR